jgi:hypothetical protein
MVCSILRYCPLMGHSAAGPDTLTWPCRNLSFKSVIIIELTIDWTLRSRSSKFSVADEQRALQVTDHTMEGFITCITEHDNGGHYHAPQPCERGLFAERLR